MVSLAPRDGHSDAEGTEVSTTTPEEKLQRLHAVLAKMARSTEANRMALTVVVLVLSLAFPEQPLVQKLMGWCNDLLAGQKDIQQAGEELKGMIDHLMARKEGEDG
jgi:hypothetical protein